MMLTDGLLSRPRVRIQLAPPFGPPDFAHFGESLEKRACTRYMESENTSVPADGIFCGRAENPKRGAIADEYRRPETLYSLRTREVYVEFLLDRIVPRATK